MNRHIVRYITKDEMRSLWLRFLEWRMDQGRETRITYDRFVEIMEENNVCMKEK